MPYDFELKKDAVRESYSKIIAHDDFVRIFRISPQYQKELMQGINQELPGKYEEIEGFVQQLKLKGEKNSLNMKKNLEVLDEKQKIFGKACQGALTKLNKDYQDKINYYQTKISQKTIEDNAKNFSEFKSFYTTSINTISQAAYTFGKPKIAEQLQNFGHATMNIMTGVAAFAGNSAALNALGLTAMSGPLAPIVAGATIISGIMPFFRKKNKGSKGGGLGEALQAISNQINGVGQSIHDHLDDGFNGISAQIEDGFKQIYTLNLKGFLGLSKQMAEGFTAISEKIDDRFQKLYSINIKGFTFLYNQINEIYELIAVDLNKIEKQNIKISNQIEFLRQETDKNFSELGDFTASCIQQLGNFVGDRLNQVDNQLHEITSNIGQLYQYVQSEFSITHFEFSKIHNRMDEFSLLDKEDQLADKFSNLRVEIYNAKLALISKTGDEFITNFLKPWLWLKGFSKENGFARAAENALDDKIIPIPSIIHLGKIFKSACYQINILAKLMQSNDDDANLYNPIAWKIVAKYLYKKYEKLSYNVHIDNDLFQRLFKELNNLIQEGRNIQGVLKELSQPEKFHLSLKKYDHAFKTVLDALEKYSEFKSQPIQEALHDFDVAYKVLFSHLMLVYSGASDQNMIIMNSIKSYLSNQLLLQDSTSIKNWQKKIEGHQDYFSQFKLLRLYLVKTREQYHQNIYIPVLLNAFDNSVKNSHETFVDDDIKHLNKIFWFSEVKNNAQDLTKINLCNFLKFNEFTGSLRNKISISRKKALEISNHFSEKIAARLPKYQMLIVKINRDECLLKKLENLIANENTTENSPRSHCLKK